MKELAFFFAVMSFFAFVAYGIDKRRAKKGRFRIRESVLLSLSFFGGALGGWLGMTLFHHKTRHWYFVVINFLGIVWQAAALIFLYNEYGLSFFG